MRVLVMSDSHGMQANCLKAIKNQPSAQWIIHLGDGQDDLIGLNEYTEGKSVITVKGNGFSLFFSPEHTLTEIEGIKIYCCHGHREGVKYSLSALERCAAEENATIALFGHTHESYLDYRDGLYLFNPGSIMQGSYGVIDITKAGILCTHLAL